VAAVEKQAVPVRKDRLVVQADFVAGEKSRVPAMESFVPAGKQELIVVGFAAVRLAVLRRFP